MLCPFSYWVSVVCFLILSCLCILEIKLHCLQIFSSITQVVFILFVVSFAVQMLVSLGPICLFLLLFLLPWEIDVRKYCYALCPKMLTVFSSGSFLLSCLIFRSLNYLKYIFVCEMRECSNFIDLPACSWNSFSFLMVFFAMQKFLSLIKSHLFIFAFISFALGEWSKKILLQFMSETVLLLFSSRSFMVPCLIFRYLNHFEFIFFYTVWGSVLISLIYT